MRSLFTSIDFEALKRKAILAPNVSAMDVSFEDEEGSESSRESIDDEDSQESPVLALRAFTDRWPPREYHPPVRNCMDRHNSSL